MEINVMREMLSNVINYKWSETVNILFYSS